MTGAGTPTRLTPGPEGLTVFAILFSDQQRLEPPRGALLICRSQATEALSPLECEVSQGRATTHLTSSPALQRPALGLRSVSVLTPLLVTV